MRILAIIVALVAPTLLGGWAFDAQGPYCLQDQGATNCGYPTFQACLASASGAGGYCYPNPQYTGNARPRRSSW